MVTGTNPLMKCHSKSVTEGSGDTPSLTQVTSQSCGGRATLNLGSGSQASSQCSDAVGKAFLEGPGPQRSLLHFLHSAVVACKQLRRTWEFMPAAEFREDFTVGIDARISSNYHVL